MTQPAAPNRSRQVSILGQNQDEVSTLLGLNPLESSRLVTATITTVGQDVAIASIDGQARKIGVLPISEFYPNKRWAQGNKYVLQELDQSERPMLSAVRPEMIELLLAGVTPEIRSGAVRVMAAARVVGIRAKIAVAATVTGVDPVAACLGRGANRVAWLREQLQGERVDVVAYSTDPETFIRNVFSSTTVISATVTGSHAEVVVPKHNLEAALGGGGLNQLLASRLTGLTVTIRSE